MERRVSVVVARVYGCAAGEEEGGDFRGGGEAIGGCAVEWGLLGFGVAGIDWDAGIEEEGHHGFVLEVGGVEECGWCVLDPCFEGDGE